MGPLFPIGAAGEKFANMLTQLPTKRSRKPPARIWTVPKNISDLRVQFTIDAELKKLLGRVKWEKTSAISFGRLALKTAILRAKAEVELKSDRALANKRRINSSAMQASAALDRVIKALYPDAKPESADKLVPAILDTKLEKGPQNIRALRDTARSDANILWSGRIVLRQIAEDAKRRQIAIAQARQNPGDPDKRIFVLTLAEAWCSLFSARPPLSPEKNSFLDFVRAAWGDAGQGTEEDFFQALRSARKAISATDFDFLSSDGPDWPSSGDLI